MAGKVARLSKSMKSVVFRCGCCNAWPELGRAPDQAVGEWGGRCICWRHIFPI